MLKFKRLNFLFCAYLLASAEIAQSFVKKYVIFERLDEESGTKKHVTLFLIDPFNLGFFCFNPYPECTTFSLQKDSMPKYTDFMKLLISSSEEDSGFLFSSTVFMLQGHKNISTELALYAAKFGKLVNMDYQSFDANNVFELLKGMQLFLNNLEQKAELMRKKLASSTDSEENIFLKNAFETYLNKFECLSSSFIKFQKDLTEFLALDGDTVVFTERYNKLVKDFWPQSRHLDWLSIGMAWGNTFGVMYEVFNFLNVFKAILDNNHLSKLFVYLHGINEFQSLEESLTNSGYTINHMETCNTVEEGMAILLKTPKLEDIKDLNRFASIISNNKNCADLFLDLPFDALIPLARKLELESKILEQAQIEILSKESEPFEIKEKEDFGQEEQKKDKQEKTKEEKEKEKDDDALPELIEKLKI